MTVAPCEFKGVDALVPQSSTAPEQSVPETAMVLGFVARSANVDRIALMPR
jgi:hypothetical protein